MSYTASSTSCDPVLSGYEPKTFQACSAMSASHFTMSFDIEEAQVTPNVKTFEDTGKWVTVYDHQGWKNDSCSMDTATNMNQKYFMKKNTNQSGIPADVTVE